MAWLGGAWRGMARLGTARLGKAWRGTARPGMARFYIYLNPMFSYHICIKNNPQVKK